MTNKTMVYNQKLLTYRVCTESLHILSDFPIEKCSHSNVVLNEWIFDSIKDVACHTSVKQETAINNESK